MADEYPQVTVPNDAELEDSDELELDDSDELELLDEDDDVDELELETSSWKYAPTKAPRVVIPFQPTVMFGVSAFRLYPQPPAEDVTAPA